MSPSLPSFLSFVFRRSLPNDYLTIQLEKACARDICPICTFEGESRYNWIWSFLWEHVNDPDIREEFIGVGGLCPADLWRSVEVARNVIKNSLGVSMVFQHLVKVVTWALESGHSRETWIGAAPWNFNLGQGCQACDTAKGAGRRGGSRLLLAATVDKPPGWLESGFPLCRMHFESVISLARKPEARSRLYELQNSGLAKESGGGGPGAKDRRVEAAILPVPDLFPVPIRSESIYVNASERCPVCERLLRAEGDLDAPESGRVNLCLAHYRGTRGAGAKLFAHIDPAEGSEGQAEIGDCPMCVQRGELENRSLEETVSQIEEFGARDLLCLRHLTRALGMLGGEADGAFLKDQLERLNTLIGELDDFIALHDYRYGKQPAENPDSAYRWALRFLSSEPSVYAHHLPLGGSERFLPSRRGNLASGRRA